MKRLLMGNEAIAIGAIHAGLDFASGYPGTPSTEVLETIAKEKPSGVYAEWSVNEKAALELAAGASYAGARTLVTMKQVGLNVASDPLMSLAYIGVHGGMVILSADDPGPISSQTEQDTRTFAAFAKLPCFDPSSPEEAFVMIQDAFMVSEKYGTPVIFRPTTRLCHATAVIDVPEYLPAKHVFNFEKSPKWVIFPKLSTAAHAKIEKRNPQIGEEFSNYGLNSIEKGSRLGIVSHGVNYAYVKEAVRTLGVTPSILKIATPFPFPYKLAEEFLETVDSVLCVEELDPVIERELTYICGYNSIKSNIFGKLNGYMPSAGELNVDLVTAKIAEYLNVPYSTPVEPDLPPLPVRPPVLCAGCPHRASFYAVKKAMKGKKAIFTGDIGCYTLGNAQPLEMVDTCLCMGAGITIAQGLKYAEPETRVFAFTGDSTFFASGMTGVANAVFNKHKITLIVLDNSITAMTGGQTHPGIGKTLMGEAAPKLSIPDILRAMGVSVYVTDPLRHKEAVETVIKADSEDRVSAVVFEYPCVNVAKPTGVVSVDKDKCVGCGICVNELGCPALSLSENTAVIDESLCVGCDLCVQVCPVNAIK